MPNYFFAQTGKLATCVQKTLPAVVLINTYDSNGKEKKIGTGFFIDSIGTGITNLHVLEGAQSAKVIFENGGSNVIEGFLALDKEHDLVMFKIVRKQRQITPYLRISKFKPELGEEVFSIGNPQGLTFSISNGIVSSIREDDKFGSIIQTTAPISPGSSGSPLLNLEGKLVGVISFSSIEGQNLNFAYNATYIEKMTVQSNPEHGFPAEKETATLKPKDDLVFKRFKWGSSISMVKTNETAIFKNQDNWQSRQSLNYQTKFLDLNFDLKYDFDAGQLRSIFYHSTFRSPNFDSGMMLPYGKTDEVIFAFYLLLGTLRENIGKETGCLQRIGGYSYFNNQESPNMVSCKGIEDLNFLIENYLNRPENKNKKSNIESFNFEVIWETAIDKFTLIFTYDPKMAQMVGMDAGCTLRIEKISD